MHALHSQIDEQRKHIAQAQAFADRYTPKMPEGFPARFSFWSGEPSLSIHMPEEIENSVDNRNKLLATAGEVFGRNGWKRDLNYNRTAYHWVKKVDSINVQVTDAERLENPLNGSPVPPTAFPLLLAAPADRAIAIDLEELQEFTVTFGGGQFDSDDNSLAYCFVPIMAKDREAAETQIVAVRGTSWSNIYRTRSEAGVFDYNLTERTLESVALIVPSAPAVNEEEDENSVCTALGSSRPG